VGVLCFETLGEPDFDDIAGGAAYATCLGIWLGAAPDGMFFPACDNPEGSVVAEGNLGLGNLDFGSLLDIP